jgi:hypothetical protein
MLCIAHKGCEYVLLLNHEEHEGHEDFNPSCPSCSSWSLLKFIEPASWLSRQARHVLLRTTRNISIIFALLRLKHSS